jgi:hypothetical protein
MPLTWRVLESLEELNFKEGVKWVKYFFQTDILCLWKTSAIHSSSKKVIMAALRGRIMVNLIWEFQRNESYFDINEGFRIFGCKPVWIKALQIERCIRNWSEIKVFRAYGFWEGHPKEVHRDICVIHYICIVKGAVNRFKTFIKQISTCDSFQTLKGVISIQ